MPTSAVPVPPDWPDLPDERLLDLRLADLPVRIEGSALESRIAELRAELDLRDLRFPLHFYLSDEWFTPDGTASMARPFYLAHPRLARLEKAEMPSLVFTHSFVLVTPGGQSAVTQIASS